MMKKKEAEKKKEGDESFFKKALERQ